MIKKILLLLSALILTFFIGITGYKLIEGFSVFEGFYMTLITITTVGFQEVRPLSLYGRMLTSFIIVCGVTIVAYSIGTLLKLIIEGELQRHFDMSRRVKMIKALRNHYIICGYGRIGSLIASELHSHKIPFVIVDNNTSRIEEFEKSRYLYIIDDATDDEVLVSAGIDKAKGVITVVKDDADNVYICLTARSLNPSLYILARSSDEKTKYKLLKSGANKVMLPYQIGGLRMAQAIIQPTVVDFLEMATMESELGLVMEEIVIDGRSPFIGKNLIDSNIRKEYGAIIVAIKKRNNDMIFNPQSSEIIEQNDVLVLLAKKEKLNLLNG